MCKDPRCSSTTVNFFVVILFIFWTKFFSTVLTLRQRVISFSVSWFNSVGLCRSKCPTTLYKGRYEMEVLSESEKYLELTGAYEGMKFGADIFN